eukprot:TRINITY_DN2639_c0_g1_i6.p1 TRINITY_DN2639_c0_g1~~TRINITY_DN2639_c0_g1_i6.p1  ORF type:complete len:1240 (+),score=382.36 TRINITY_DN2639_c0_g1_i6:444-4163(+)
MTDNVDARSQQKRKRRETGRETDELDLKRSRSRHAEHPGVEDEGVHRSEKSRRGGDSEGEEEEPFLDTRRRERGMGSEQQKERATITDRGREKKDMDDDDLQERKELKKKKAEKERRRDDYERAENGKSMKEERRRKGEKHGGREKEDDEERNYSSRRDRERAKDREGGRRVKEEVEEEEAPFRGKKGAEDEVDRVRDRDQEERVHRQEQSRMPKGGKERDRRAEEDDEDSGSDEDKQLNQRSRKEEEKKRRVRTEQTREKDVIKEKPKERGRRREEDEAAEEDQYQGPVVEKKREEAKEKDKARGREKERDDNKLHERRIEAELRKGKGTSKDQSSEMEKDANKLREQELRQKADRENKVEVDKGDRAKGSASAEEKALKEADQSRGRKRPLDETTDNNRLQEGALSAGDTSSGARVQDPAFTSQPGLPLLHPNLPGPGGESREAASSEEVKPSAAALSRAVLVDLTHGKAEKQPAGRVTARGVGAHIPGDLGSKAAKRGRWDRGASDEQGIGAPPASATAAGLLKTEVKNEFDAAVEQGARSGAQVKEEVKPLPGVQPGATVSVNGRAVTVKEEPIEAPVDPQAAPAGASLSVPAVPGKSVLAGKPAGMKSQFTLDALAKAKAALQRQKEFAKKNPQLAKPTSLSIGTPSSAAPSTIPAPTSLPPPPSLSTPLTPTMPSASALPPPGMPPAAPSHQSPFMPGLFPGLLPGVSGMFPNMNMNMMPGMMPSLDAMLKAQQAMAQQMGFALPTSVAPPVQPSGAWPPTGPPSTVEGGGAAAAAAAGAAEAKPAKAPVLRLDKRGRELDEEGNVVERVKQGPISTLKVNIRQAKKEAFKILRPDLEEDPFDSPFFDPSMGATNRQRLLKAKKREISFVPPGEMSKRAEIHRFRTQMGEARMEEFRARQEMMARARADTSNPNLIQVAERKPMEVEEKKAKDPIPDTEWWDSMILQHGKYDLDVEDDGVATVKDGKITFYVEHPVPVEPPAEAPPPPPQPLKLTKREQKKLRTQRRLAREKERQEMIRQGLLEAPKAKVKMSNLMKVLGAEATQDPTRMEQQVKSAAAEREQAHADRNMARKLSATEKREKKERKLFEDPESAPEWQVSVYRVVHLGHPQTRFKVDKNAQENRLKGCVVMTDDMAIVIVEGGLKSIKRFGKLMLRRIKWEKAVVEAKIGDPRSALAARPNECKLVWQGAVAKPAFEGDFQLLIFPSGVGARRFLEERKCAHYWDLASNLSND